jgi:hypothetical protein
MYFYEYETNNKNIIEAFYTDIITDEKILNEMNTINHETFEMLLKLC